jgi:hypothetical protein
MKKLSYTFSSSSTQFYFDADFSFLEKILDKNNAVIITDENIFSAHKKKFKGWSAIVLNAGEKYKLQSTVDEVIEQLIALEADRNTFLIGVEGESLLILPVMLRRYICAVFHSGSCLPQYWRWWMRQSGEKMESTLASIRILSGPYANRNSCYMITAF